MIERAVFGAGMLLLAVYTFTPRGDAGGVADADAPAETGKPEAANGWGKPKVAAAQRKTSYTSGGQTILPRNRDGHFYADIRVNGSTNRFLVDTGASVVALTAGDAQAAGLTWDDSEVREIGSGASGAVYGVPVVLDDIVAEGIARNRARGPGGDHSRGVGNLTARPVVPQQDRRNFGPQ